MVTVRHIARSELAAFARLAGATPAAARLETALAEMWAAGESRPEWCFVAERDGRAAGRLAVAALPLGCGLDIIEHRLTALRLADEGKGGVAVAAVAAALLRAAAGALPDGPQTLDARLNAESHPHLAEWRQALERTGFALFQEKQGFLWTDPRGPLTPPARLTWQSLADAGRDAFAAAMALGIAGTLDRNDRHYVGVCGAERWGREMLGYLGPGDEQSWLLARAPDGTLAGYVAVSPFDEPDTATIIHIGVLPEHRGHGYIDELIAAAGRAARARGRGRMLSDVDTENGPMLAAMRRAGHVPDARAWHVWHYRHTAG